MKWEIISFKYSLILFWLHWIFLATGGLFSSCGKQGYPPVSVHRLLTVVTYLVAEYRLQGTSASVVATPQALEHKLSSSGAWA